MLVFISSDNVAKLRFLKPAFKRRGYIVLVALELKILCTCIQISRMVLGAIKVNEQCKEELGLFTYLHIYIFIL